MESAIRIINTAIESSSDSISEKEECLVRGFGSAVDSAVRSSTAPNSEVSSVHGFGRAVENGIKSSTSSNLEAPESADSFGWTVENATRSRVAPNPPPLYGYSSTVDHAISSDVGVEAETEESPSGTFYEGFTEYVFSFLSFLLNKFKTIEFIDYGSKNIMIFLLLNFENYIL